MLMCIIMNCIKCHFIDFFIFSATCVCVFFVYLRIIKTINENKTSTDVIVLCDFEKAKRKRKKVQIIFFET